MFMFVLAVSFSGYAYAADYLPKDKASDGNVVVAESIAPMPVAVSNTNALGAVLYTQYIYPFQLAGIVLLVAMIGAIVLTHRVRDGVRKQNVAGQVSRSRKDSVEIIKVQSGKGV